MAIKTNANQAASDGLDTAINRVGHGICSNAELAHGGMSTGLQAATAAVGAASGVLGVMLLKVGVKDMIHGIRHKKPSTLSKAPARRSSALAVSRPAFPRPVT